MKRINIIVVLIAAFPAMLWAGSSSYYSALKAQVSSSSAGMGRVYAGTTNLVPEVSSYDATASQSGNQISISAGSNSTARTFYAFALANDGYEFAGWSTNDNGSTISTANPYPVSVNGSSTNAAQPTLATVYANFNVAKAADAQTTYMVIDLSNGSYASNYPVSYLADVPAGGWTDEYKTTKLVLRRIPAGTFVMGSPETELGHDYGGTGFERQHDVTLTKPFYIGVFEVTRKQYELIVGSVPSNQYPGDLRPMTWLSYDALRGPDRGAHWPYDNEVDSSSFMGIMRERTGLVFDLPTEAQWEYACRAGTATALYNGKEITDLYECTNVAEIARYLYNANDGKGGYNDGFTVVGSYLPNAWGLYDMSGNALEWCRDWWSDSLTDGIDPVGASNGTYRVIRSACGFGLRQADSPAATCRSAYRTYGHYRYTSPSSNDDPWGFRVMVQTEEDGGAALQTVNFTLSWPTALTSVSCAIDGVDCGWMEPRNGTAVISGTNGASVTLTGSLGYATKTVTGTITDNGMLALPAIDIDYYFPLTATAGQDGTAAHPYEIADAQGLFALQEATMAGFGRSLSYVQSADIDMAGRGPFAGIGVYNSNPTKGVPFTGTYNGCRHKISNIDFTQRNYGGIFNQVNGGRIINLIVENITCSTFDRAVNNGEWGCAIVGNAGNGALLGGLVAKGSFGSGDIPCTHDVAGIVVRLSGGTTNATSVISCTNNATLFGGYTRLGGICAITQRTVGSAPVHFSQCVNAGEIVALDPWNTGMTGTDGIAGIVAYSAEFTRLTRCSNIGNIHLLVPVAMVGELVGLHQRFSLSDGGGNRCNSGARMVGGTSSSSNFRYATVSNGVATTVTSLTNGVTFLLEGGIAASETPVFTLSAANDFIAFDTALGYSFNGTVAASEGLEVSSSTVGTVTTYTAVPAVVTHTVTFDLGEHGTRTGGGELVQTVTNGCAAVAPEFTVEDGYDFTGWDGSFDHVTSNLTITATYFRLKRPVSVNNLNIERVFTDAGVGMMASVFPGASLVDFSFNVTCDDPSQTNYVYFVARDEANGAEYPIRTIDGDHVFTSGNYHISWNASADLPAGIVGSIRIHAFATAHPLAHRWGFNGNYLDTAGTMDAMVTGAVTMNGGAATLAGGVYGTSYITLGQEAFPKPDEPFTIELWARQNAVRTWSRIFDIGTSNTDYFYWAWTAQTDINVDSGHGGRGHLAPFTIGTDYHIVVVMAPNGSNTWDVSCYKQDSVSGETLRKLDWSWTSDMSLGEKTFYLGHSFFAADYDASATYSEVRIWNAALRESELTRNVLAGADIATNSAAATSAAVPAVTFDLGGHGTRMGGGELVQVVADGGNAIAPEVMVDFGWLFAGWSESFSNVTSSVNVTAHYDSAFPFDATNAMDGVAYEGMFGNLTGMSNLVWSASGLPEGLTLSADGTLSGTVLATGTFNFSVTVSAPNGASRTMPVSIHVAENLNHRPVVSGTIPTAIPDLAMPGNTLEFDVAASDPDGDALSYVWLIDGVTNAVNTTGAFTWTPEELDGGTRLVTCLVTDGFWYIPAGGGWRVSIPKWYVSADGSSTNAGTTTSTPFREIQSAVDVAVEGDVIFVAEGVYGPINTANKRIRIIATGALDKTIIDGGGTNRCVYVGNQWSNYIPTETNSYFKGFTICNGCASDANGCGGGVSGGRFDQCVLERNRVVGEKWGGAAFRAILYNCLVTGNTAMYGGGADSSSLYNCTVVSNTATGQGGGIYNVHVRNTIVWDNVCTAGNSYSNNYNSISATIAYSCVAPAASGTRNICTNPYFTDPANGDWRLRQYSPCLDAGNNAYVVGDSDLSGTNRVIDGTVDMGAFEGWVYLPVPEVIEDVSAEDGTRIGIVRLTWTADAYARLYSVYRAETNIVEAATQIGETADLFYDDETATPENTYWYWVKGVNPTGEGPFGANDSGWCMSPMEFGGNALATATAGLPYNEQLAISGGSGHYTWTSGADDYDTNRWASTYLMDIDSPRGLLFGDDVSTAYPLPFDFPFYGHSYNKLWISSNGTLTFDGNFTTYSPSLGTFKSRVMITPFWKDLLQGSGGVYVSENGDESVTFMWYNGMYYSGHGLVNASVTLFADGSIVCSYGDGNANGAFVGISAGDGTRYRYFDLQGQSLNNADDIVFIPQDVPGGLTLGTDGVLSGTPTVPGEYVFTVFVTDEYGNGATRQISVTVEENPNMRTVTFDLGEYGVRGGGGDLHQYVLLGESAVAPTVRVRAGWVFDGWIGAFTNIADSVTVTARYRIAYADLHVDEVAVRRVGDNVPQQGEMNLAATAGDTLTVFWTVGNTGNPPFTVKMTEYVRFIDAANTSNVMVVATIPFDGTIARDGTVERSAEITLPLKGMEGEWIVEVETAVNPSVREYTGNNTRRGATVTVAARPLPDLAVNDVSVSPASFMPGDTVTVTYVEANVGGAEVATNWLERIVLEDENGKRVSLMTVVGCGVDVTNVIECVIPELVSLAGDMRFVVETDFDDGVVEIDDEANNVARSGTVSLGKRLYLTSASDSVKENVSSGVRFTVKRSGPTTEALTVTLGNSDATSASIPETVTIPAGSVSTVFYVKPINNATVEGARMVEVSVSAEGFDGVALPLMILDDEVPHLYITLDTDTIREGEGVIIATVRRELVTDEPLTVYLSGASTSRCSYPSSVTIAAGEASATFEISVPNNATAQIAQELTLRASSSGYTSGSVNFTVDDDDVPGVTLSLTPEVVSEGAGAQAIYATLTRNDTNQIAQAVRVRLTASEANQLILPSEITIPKYTMAVRFAIGVVDNALDDGDREVTINGAIVIESCGCDGQPSNGDVIQATVGIIDNDGPALSLSASPTTMKEGLNPAGNLILSHNSTLTEPLVVRLWVDAENEGEISIPATQTINPGETSVCIPVMTLDDGVEDGGKLVSVYAATDDDTFASASTWIQVSDQNLPDLTIANVETVASVVAMEDFNVSFTVTNIGFMATTRAIPYAIHLVNGANASAVSSATLVKSGTLTGGLDIGAALNGAVTLTAPELPGDYRVAVVIDPDGTISELDSANNTGWSSAIGVTVAYTATAGVDKKVYMPGETVTITGVVSRADGTTAGNVQIDPYVMLSGMRRSLLTTTAADGSYSAVFTPTSGEAGDYAVGACYPGVNSKVPQESFSIIGMKRSSTANVIWDIALGDSATRAVTIQNRSAVPLTGLTVTFTDVPEECGFTYSLPDTIPANGSVTLSMSATADGLTDQVDYRQFYAHLAVDEGLTLDFPLYFHSQAQRAYLRATPTSINTTMAIGHTRYIEVALVNDGKGDSGAVSVSVPDVNWLKIVSGASIDNLASGESATITLAISPTSEDGLTLNSPLSGGSMAVNCANGMGCSVSLKFTPVSEATGGITVDAVDNNTYYLDSKPHLENAFVRISNPYTGVEVASGYTDVNGLWFVEGIAEGEYQLTVTADKHDTYANKISVEPGRTARATAFLQCQVVSASWTVVRNEIEDSYEISLIMEYETQVPAPIVKVTMPDSFPDLAEGESLTFSMHVENQGVIAAESVHLFAPDIPDHDFTFSDNDFKLPAGSARDIAVKFEHIRSQRRLLKAGKGLKVGSWLMGHLISFICGDYGSYTGFNFFKYGKSEVVVIGDDDDEIEDVVVPEPGVVIITPPKRKPGEPTEPEPGTFSGNSSSVNISGCDIAKCLATIAGCVIDFAVNETIGRIPECLMGLADCGGAVVSTINNPERTKVDIGSAALDCGLGVASCAPLSEDAKNIISAIICLKGVGEKCIIPAYQWVKEKITKKKNRALTAASGNSLDEDKGNELIERFPDFAYAISIGNEELSAIRNWHVELFGDEAWMMCPADQKVAFLTALKNNFPAEGSYISVDALLPYRPEGISIELVERFVSRWNAFLRGDSTNENADAGESSAFRPMYLVHCSEIISECEELVAIQGYSSIFEYLGTEAEAFQREIEDERNSVCASVTLRLSQTLTMTREAFDGTLTMYNGNKTTPITDLKLNVSVLDEDGNECKDLFEIFANGTSGDMSDGSALAGGLSVAAGGTGSAMVRFIPERGAAPTEEKLYRFGGTVTYTDPFSGETATVKLTPVSLTVSPSPYLHLDYFVQRDVFADDPFTPDVVEASMPAELAVLVRNVGGGNANKVTIASAQPEMVQNEKGLLAAFNLKDYTLEASALNGATSHLSLTAVPLGTIEPNESKVAQWWLTSTIEGHFIGMSATVTPVNSWNTPDTMLVDPDVGVHKLVRSVVADGDTLPDFLVCDGSDLYGTPNEIYTAVGDQLPVCIASVATSTTLPAGGEITLPLSLTPVRSGWNYGYATISGISRYTISRIVRGDGTEISLRNAWITDRTFRDGNTPLLEDRLHIVDEFASGAAQIYTVYLAAKPSDVPSVTAFEGVTDGAIEYIARNAVTVVFSKPIDPVTFTVDDLTLIKQGAYLSDLSSLTIERADDSNTRFTIGNLSALCGGLGRYELTVQCAGIADTVGQLGTVGKSVAWTCATAEAPYVIGVDGVPVHRVQSLDTISVTFSAPIKPETFTSAALRLNGATVGSGVTIATLDASGTRFSVSGLSSVQTADGEYTLVIDATAVAGLDDTPGVNTYTATWTRDTVAPVLQSLTRTDELNGNEFILTFSEDVTSESLTTDKATLKRNNSVVALPGNASLRRVGDNAPCQWVLSGIDSALAEDGTYELCFSADGVTDEAGNVASGSKSVTWTVDRTAPAQIADLAISPDGGFSDTDGITYTGALTVSGTLPEAGLTVEIVVKDFNGSEIELATIAADATDASIPFSQSVTLPRDGNMTLIVRLTDAAGNSSETMKNVFVDGIALTGELSRVLVNGADSVVTQGEAEGVVTTTATLAFSAKPMEADVTFDKFALTRDGETVALEGVTFAKVDDTTFALTGLDSLCAEDGVYVLTFNGSAVRKYTSGLLMSGSPIMMTWRYENPDREPPTVTEVLFDGEMPHEAYTNVFSSVYVTFSEAVNVPELIANGLIGRAARIDLLDAANSVTGSAVIVSAMTWDGESNTLSWQIDPLAVPVGRTRLTLDAGLIEDLAGNHLSADGYAATDGMRTYTLSETVLAQVNAQAMPMWYNGELYVGEKTADNKGKIRHYAANGTWSYLQSVGVDIEIPAQGCQGASVAFADMDGDGAVETYIGTTGGDVLKYPGGTTIASLGVNRAMPYVYDIDGDGCDELVAGGMDGRIRVISRDAATGTYSMTVLTDVNGAALSVPNGRAAPVVADINHDGLVDIVSGDTAGNVWVYLGAGGSQFTAAVADAINCVPPVFVATPVCIFTNNVSLADRSRLGYGDVNDDGIEDLIVGRSDGSVVAMLGTETPSPIIPFAVKAVVSASAGTNGAIAPVGDATYDGGDTPEYTIMPDIGYHVADVLVDGVSIGATNNYVFAPLTTSHTIHADFATVPYAISYTGLKGATNTNPETYTVEDEITFAAPGAVYGWVFKGWTPASIALGSTGDIEVTASWARAKFDVTVNGEAHQYSYEDEVTFTAPEAWDADGMQVVTLGTTFTAPIVTNEFTMTVTNNFEFTWDILATNWWFETAETVNGSITAPEAGWITDGEVLALAAVPAEHYHFVGWTGETEGCVETNGTGLVVTMDRARTIGATFAIDTFTVTFDAGAHGSLAGDVAQTVNYGGTAVAPTVTPDAGYEFTGWSGDVAAPVAGDATFTAQYATVPYAISYTGLKGATNPNPETYTVEDVVTFAEPGEVYGWVFTGWTPASIALGSTGAVEVSATWERQKFDVTVNGETHQYSYEELVAFTTNAVVNCGATQYVCKGWTATNAEPESGEGARAEFKVLGNVTLDWLWETNVVSLEQSVNADGLEWTTGGAAEWLPEWSENASDGEHDAYCGSIRNGTNAWIVATVEGPGTIAFKWRSALAAKTTKYQFMVDGEVKGMLTGTNGWMEATVSVLGDRTHELKWRLLMGRSGSSAGDRVALDEVVWTPTTPPTLAEALNTNLVWTTDGDVSWRVVSRESLVDDREAWAVVDGLGDDETSAVQTRVYGSGILTFDWAISCEEDYDWMELTVDGEVREYITGEKGWTTTAIEIDGDGWHTVSWEYIKDEMDDEELAGDNVAKLDNVVWKSDDVLPTVTETRTTPIPVPYAELEGKRFSSYLEQASGDYEAAAHMIGRNGYAIWECYLAGLEPELENSKFRSKIEMVDGKPVVTWEPDTPELRATRVYRTLGKKTLLDANWTDITDKDQSEYHFFKVTVDLP